MRLSALDLPLMIAVALIVVGVVGIARSQSSIQGDLPIGQITVEPTEYPGYYCGSHDCQLHVDATSKFAPIPAQTPDYRDWGVINQRPAGELYAFCDTDWPEVCNQKVLMLKDACEQTVEVYGNGSDRFSCAVVDDATRDAYMRTVDRDVYERTVEAWAAGR